jgi:hypothetical protein
MDSGYLNEVEAELVLIVADEMSNRPMENHYKTILNRIKSLNIEIDNEIGNEPLYSLLVQFAYNYYRLKDRFISF